MSRMAGNFDRIAGAHVTGATGAAVVADGCATARTGAGVYTVTLDLPTDNTNRLAVACLQDTAIHAFIEVVNTSDSVLGIKTYNAAGAATDYDFSILVFRTI